MGCTARFIEKTGKIKCGEENIPWLTESDMLSDFEKEKNRKKGRCNICCSLQVALNKKNQWNYK